ncbi:MAG TPA: bacillithiol biosynthesis BshC, partial [Candidatus Krumholzibacteria bacterium]|nr:bacillithiol biosynthesis BshC [Candidatus Krumholzibacteria bacterium]
ALYLRLFAEAGLVTIDARSRRLRELGRELMLRYARRSAEIAASVEEKGRALSEAGFSVPLHSAATSSGLFRIHEGKREKLEPEELLSACEAGEDLSPAVLMRPLLQDELLAPLAAILGPSELHYHAQLAPAYELLGVEAAAPALRPQLTFFPDTLPWPKDEERQKALLQGGDGAREVLGTLTVPAEWERARAALKDSLDVALDAFERSLKDAASESKIARALRKLRETAGRVEDSLAAQALQRAGEEQPAILLIPELLGLRGSPQERTYAAVAAWEWFGEDFPRCLQELGELYARDLKEGRAPLYLGRMSLEAT